MSCKPFARGYACSIDLFAQEPKPKEVKEEPKFDLKKYAARQEFTPRRKNE